MPLPFHARLSARCSRHLGFQNRIDLLFALTCPLSTNALHNPTLQLKVPLAADELQSGYAGQVSITSPQQASPTLFLSFFLEFLRVQQPLAHTLTRHSHCTYVPASDLLFRPPNIASPNNLSTSQLRSITFGIPPVRGGAVPSVITQTFKPVYSSVGHASSSHHLTCTTSSGRGPTVDQAHTIPSRDTEAIDMDCPLTIDLATATQFPKVDARLERARELEFYRSVNHPPS